MALTPGARLGPYDVSALIGVGGMGEVYKATDTQLKRQVAIKVLPQAVAADAERLARFQREAEVLASLNHPNIAGIHGLEKSDGTTALILELVEGPTLADRIAEGPVPLEEALPIAHQIVEALEAAHQSGIVHRDLKPANIKLRPDGTVKVLDFGLAKPGGVAGTADAELLARLTQSPTVLSPAVTGVGLIMGTASYMSPEQAKGKPADKRSDVWAFGCVLYEMLTGRRAFGGEDVADTLAAVVRAEPDWKTLPSATPSPVRRLLRRCLVKDLRQRLPEMASVRLEIEDARGAPEESAATLVAPPPARERVAWAVVALLAITLAGLAAVMLNRPLPEAPERRLEITTPPTTRPGSFALSADGLQLAFVATSNGRPMLWRRSLQDGTVQPLAGTEGARLPFWSPEGRSIGFLVSGDLKRVDLGDGSVRTLVDRAGEGQGGSWSVDGEIVFASAGVGPLYRYSTRTGKENAATRIVEGEIGHAFPWFLPDGKHFVYLSMAQSGASIQLANLDESGVTRLLDADRGSVALISDHLVFVRQGALVAQPFDLARRQMSGEPFRLIAPSERSGVDADSTRVDRYRLSASSTDTIAFRPITMRTDLVWFDRKGNEIGRIDSDGELVDPDVAPDGRRVVANRGPDIWLFDAGRGVPDRLTSGGGIYPVFSSGGRRVAFLKVGQGTLDLYVQDAVRGAPEERVLSTPSLKSPTALSRDGHLLFQETSAETGGDVWVLSLDGERKPVPVANSRSAEGAGQFSPDGTWVTYHSNETGRMEVYAQPFPGGPSARVPVSRGGGREARWGDDGREIFYLAPDDRLMTVSVVPGRDKSLEFGPPKPLFPTRIPEAQGGQRLQYDVADRGQKFLIRTIRDDPPEPITLILNWKPQR